MAPSGGVEKLKLDLDIILPIKTLEDFLQFEETLMTSEMKKNHW